MQPDADLAPQVPFVVRNRISQPVLGVTVEVEVFGPTPFDTGPHEDD
jgi:hypothetical protein